MSGRGAVPELLQENATAAKLAQALAPLIGDTPERAAQVDAFAQLDERMRLDNGEAPSQRAARVVLDVAARR